MPEIVVKLGDNVLHKYFVDKDIISVGRARDNDIVIENLSVSRNHARLRRQDGKYILTDLNSANGTYVNGVKISKTEIVNDDIITIGKHKLHFVDKQISDEQIIADAFGADRTMIVDKTPTAVLVVTKGKQKDQEFKITKFETTIGRGSDNDICIHDWFVSKKHALLIRQGQNFFIKDLGSWKGTHVNGKYVKDMQLNDGDTIQLGTTYISIRISTEEELMQISGRVPKELAAEEEYEESATPEEALQEEVEMAVAEASGSNESEEEKEESLEELEVGFERLEEEEEEEPAAVSVEEEEEEELVEGKGVEAGVAAQSEEKSPKKPVSESQEVTMWEKALQNKSQLIRREAARKLKKLTGKDYSDEQPA